MAENITEKSTGDVWYVYDGECPLCRTAAQALRIREAAGNLRLINAREDKTHPVLREINARGLDLDKGTVLKFGGQYYHGGDVMVMMALLGSGKGWFNKMNALLFRSRTFARFCYPAIRGGRNFLLWCKGVDQLHNLATDHDTPIFAPLFGKAWGSLPPVLHKHYANRPYSNDVITAEGIMTVEMSPFARLLSPLFRLTGTLVPYSGTNIPITVHFRSEPDSHAFCFDRIFNFPGHAPYRFRSRMIPSGGNEVIEYMRVGIGWNASYRYDGNKVLIEHRGYRIKFFDGSLRLPLEWVMGRGYAEEEAIDDNHFRMLMTITHPLLGKFYSYSGEFRI